MNIGYSYSDFVSAEASMLLHRKEQKKELKYSEFEDNMKGTVLQKHFDTQTITYVQCEK